MKTILFLLLMSLFEGIIHGQTSVHITSNKTGRGILKERENEVFVIAPQHIFDNEISSCKIVGERNVSSHANLLQTFPIDIAILKIEDGGKQRYSDWTIASTFEMILNNSFSGYLEFREEDGSVKLIKVDIVAKDNEFISIQSYENMTSLIKGLSGSTLFANTNNEKVFLGLLLDIDESIGHVIRADYMMNILSGFFPNKEIIKPKDVVPNITKSTNKELGDICFLNKRKYSVRVNNSNVRFMTLEPGESQCWYGFIPRNYNYQVHSYNFQEQAFLDKIKEGQFNIEAGISKTIVIK